MRSDMTGTENDRFTLPEEDGDPEMVVTSGMVVGAIDGKEKLALFIDQLDCEVSDIDFTCRVIQIMLEGWAKPGFDALADEFTARIKATWKRNEKAEGFGT